MRSVLQGQKKEQKHWKREGNMTFVGGRTLGLVNYLCNIVSKAVAEDRGLPFLLVACLYLQAVSSLKNFILLLMEA